MAADRSRTNAGSSGEAPPRKLAQFVVRTVTAAAYATIMLLAIFFGRPLGLGIVLSIAAMLAVGELYAITRREHRLPNEVLGILAVGIMPIAAGLWEWIGLMTAVTALVVAAVAWHVSFRQVRLSDTAVTVFGALYVGMLLSFFVLIRHLDDGTILALATIASVWANDVFAYLVGSTVGRHKMAPRISPHKSWEGFAAGTLFTVLVWLIVGWITPVDYSFGWLLLTGISVSIASVLGDLFESRIKRETGVKDSGHLLPGHGGFLDRFDSLILVSIVAYHLLVLGIGQ